MEAERWQRINDLFLTALEHEPAGRSAFINEACAGDNELRREVESLLAAHEDAPEFIEEPVVGAAARLLLNEHADSMTGRQIGHYQIISLLGAGGMGEVHLATDMKLGRQVAIKLLPIGFTMEADRVRRFQREAHAASALNHPNILTIHEIGQEGSLHFMATEYVEGETLREKILGTRMALGQVLDIAAQVASALAAAHQAGIIHRDIKPENIMVRTDDYVKVLDFGLAKLTDPNAAHSAAPTPVKVETEPGVVMGTFSYMSPEQARGVAVDARTDIWSLGVMLYEMVAGRQPFEGDTASDVMSLILQKEPLPLAHSWPEVPAELERIVRKALRKDTEERYQTSKDLLIDLRSLRKELERVAEIERSMPPISGRSVSSGQSTAAIAHSTSSAEYIVTEIKQHKRAAALILGTLVIASVGAWYLFSRRSKLTKQAAPVNATFTQLTDQSGPEYFPSLSPDGKSFVYAGYASGNWDIYLQRVGGKNPINLTKDSPADDTQPVFSPDGERIAFRSERDGGGIFVMGATGESGKRLTDFGYNPAWSPDGKEIAWTEEDVVDNPIDRFFPLSKLWSVNITTGEKRLITKGDAVQASWSPHGSRIAYWANTGGQRDIWTIAASGGEPVQVTNDSATNWNPIWEPSGKYLYFVSDRGGSMNLWRVPVEEQSGKVLGPLEQVTTPSPYSQHISFSADGRRVAYAQVVRRANIQGVGFDPAKETITGQPTWITQGSRLSTHPDLSPDGEWFAFSTQKDIQEDLFIIRKDGTGQRQLTDDIYRDRRPRWSPDGKQIAFFSNRSGKFEVWTIHPDASELRQLTYTPKGVTGTEPIWSPDGTRLAYNNRGDPSNTGGEPSIIEVGKPWREQSPRVLDSPSAPHGWAVWSWSSDGKRLAGTQAHGGDSPSGVAVYTLESQQFEKLTDFGRCPVWLSDNRRLLFNYQGKLYLVDAQSKKVHEVWSVAPGRVGIAVTLSRDDRQLYVFIETAEADIWLMTLE